MILIQSCTRARFTEFRGDSLGATSAALSEGKKLAEKHCASCHLTPLPESMSQDNAAYMLAYMGLFLGIDASGKLDDVEKAHFKQRYEFLKKAKKIPESPQLTATEWKSLRAYYLGLARHPFQSSEKAEPTSQENVPFPDDGVTLLQRLADGRIAVGGGVQGTFSVLNTNLKPELEIKLDSPPVHLEESDGGFYVLTLGSLFGTLGDANLSAVYFIDPRTKSARKNIAGLERSAHFILTETNGDGKKDFIVAGFGSITGGSIILFESRGNTYDRKILSSHESIVRLALVGTVGKRVEFLALAGGAREALLHIVLENGIARERTLVEYPPHLGSVWLETQDLDGDGKREILVLSGDNADSGPYNETKPDQGLRIYSFDGMQIKQLKFESLPGALTLAILPGNRIAVARFYAAPDARQDMTILEVGKNLVIRRRHLTLNSRPTVLTGSDKNRILVGAGNLPLLTQEILRKYDGPVLSVVQSAVARE